MMEFGGLVALGRKDLLRLAALLKDGVLTPPLSELSLRQHLADAHAAPVAQCLAELTQRDMSPDHIALLLHAFVEGTQVTKDLPMPVEIVVSGPDVTGSTRDTGVVMRQLFDKARTRAMAVGFAVHQGKSVFKNLADRLDGDHSFQAILCIDIRRDHGSTSLEREIVQRFANEFVHNEWPGTRLPRVYYDPRSLETTGRTASSMHAKCVVVDGLEALVTSANFTEAAQERNIELGLLVHSNVIAESIEKHFMSLIRNEHLKPLPLS